MTRHEVEEWEDVDDDSKENHEPTSEPSATPRKHPARKPAPRSSSPLTKTSRGGHGQKKPLLRDGPHAKRDWNGRWSDAVVSALLFFISYVAEVLRVALVWLRKPLSLILVGYLLAVMVSHLRAAFVGMLRSTLDPVCFLPGISRLAICHSSLHPTGDDLSSGGSARHVDYPALVKIQSASFEHLLDESVGGAGLALEIKKAEMATSDLITLVRVSSLTSKDRIAETLDVFVESARHAARGLQRFSAKVGGAVDSIVAMNDYALREIETAVSAKSFAKQHWPSVWIPFFFQRPTSLAVITKSFTETMGMLESELHRLILAAEASLHDLDVLEEQLRLLHTIVSREDLSLSISKQETLASLWTLFGGNRADLQRFDTHLELLGGVAEYRRQALAHVVGALHTLQTMGAELEGLRERVAQPVMVGDAIPLEVHVKSIRGGLDRLLEGRLKVKRIEDARYARLLAP